MGAQPVALATPVTEPEHLELADLDLSFDRHLAPALREGEAEYRRYGPLDPPNLPGAARWGRIVRVLRERLEPAGWTWDNPRNLPRVIHPDRTFALVVYTGDVLTGLTGTLPPSTKHHKGPTAASVVARNAVQTQLALEFPGLDAPRGVPVDLVTWILLVHRDAREIRSEVSLPASIDPAGHIDRWLHRIPLPVLPAAD